MKRKVIKQGPATLMISLPSDWARKYGIKRGDEINLLVQDKKIIVSPESQKIMGEVKISIPSPKQFLKRLIHIPYVMGYDKIIIEYADRKIADLARKELQRLMGFEMVEETDKHCVILNVAKGIEEEFDTIFHGQIKLLLQFHEEVAEILKSRDKEKINSTIERDLQFTRFNLFSKRMLNKIGYSDDSKTKGFYAYCVLLEMCSDSLKAICEIAAGTKEQLSKELIDLFDLSVKHTELFCRIVRTYDINDLVKLKEIRNQIFSKINENIVNKSAENILLYQVYTIVNAAHHATEEVR